MDLVRAGEAAIADGVVSVQKKAREKSRFDTHPSNEERIAAVRAFAPNVRLEIDGTAERLFQDLSAICRRATADAYARIFGPCSSSRNLIPARDAMARMEEARGERAAAMAMFGHPVEFCARWFRLDEILSPSGGEWNEAPRDNRKPEEFDRLERRNLLHYAALRIAQCGVSVNPESFELQTGNIEGIEAGEAASRREWSRLKEQLRAATWRARERLQRVREAAAPPGLDAAWTTYEALSRYQAEFDEIRRLGAAAAIARENARLFSAAACANLLEELSESANAAMARILANTGEIAASVILDPQRPATLSGQLTPPAEEPGEKVSIFLDRAALMASRALGQLCWRVVKAGDEETMSQTA